MANYIDKDALVAELQRLSNEWRLLSSAEAKYRREVYTELLSFIDTFEVKEVDLEKFTEKINTFQARYKHPEIISIKGAMAFMARMFYQYPNVAREWYESMPKATMD